MGDDDGGAFGLYEEVAEHGLHFGAGEGVEGAEGFVHEEDGGLVDDGAGQADALALTSAELPGVAVEKVFGEAHMVEHDGGAAPDLEFGQAG